MNLGALRERSRYRAEYRFGRGLRAWFAWRESAGWEEDSRMSDLQRLVLIAVIGNTLLQQFRLPEGNVLLGSTTI